MRDTIYKYRLVGPGQGRYGEFEIMMPNDSHIISAVNVNDQMIIYAEVDPADLLVHRKVWVEGTGQPRTRPEDAVFIGTVVLNGYVWHVYKLRD